jgi:hypothetical protein
MIVAECGCGRGYDEDGWKALSPIGLQEMPGDAESPAVLLELRACVCGSTISYGSTRTSFIRRLGPERKANGD